MDCWPVVGALVETVGILVVPTLAVSPGSLTGALVPEALLGAEVSGVCTVVALGYTTESVLLSSVTAGFTVWGWLGIPAAAEVAPVTTAVAAPAATDVVTGGAVGLSVTMGACVWVGDGLTVGLDVAATVIAGVGTAVVGFAGVGACVGSFFIPASPVGGAVVAPAVMGLPPIVAALDGLLLCATTVGAGVAGTASFVTDVAPRLPSLEQTI